MSSNAALTLEGEDSLPIVKVRASAVFSILSNFVRRGEKQARVIGTLVGCVNEGNVVEITDCFGVPHQEKIDELYVAVNTDYHKSMFKFHKRIYRRDAIVGWYTTSTPDGAQIVDNSSLIHDFYRGECAEPVHLVVDTTLAGDNLGIRAFVSQPMVVGLSSFANMFLEVNVKVMLTEGEITCLHHMIHGQSGPLFDSSVVFSTAGNEREKLIKSLEKLTTTIEQLSEYVDRVVSGKEEANMEIGMAISNAIDAVNQVRPSDFQSNFQGRVQDLVMLSYINTLTQTQIAIADKLSSVL